MISRVQRVTSPLVVAAILLTLTYLASRTEAQETRKVTIYEESLVPPTCCRTRLCAPMERL